MKTTVRKSSRTVATQLTKNSKKPASPDLITSDSEDENANEKSPKKIKSPAKSNTSTPKKILRKMLDSSDSEYEYDAQPKRIETIKRRLTELVEEPNDQPKETPVKTRKTISVVASTSTQNLTPKTNKRTSASKAADLNNKEPSENVSVQTERSKRSRRLTSVTPSEPENAESPTNTDPRRSRRASSVISTASSTSKKPRRSRRSLARTMSESEVKETSNDESEFVKPKTVKKLKKTTSVVSSGSETSSVDKVVVPEDRKVVKVTVLLSPTTKKQSETSIKSRQNCETTPSPTKKSSVEQTSTAKKIRKLYHPNDVAVFSSQEDEDERERKEHQKQKAQKSPDGVFVNPNKVDITPLPSQRKPNRSNIDLDEGSGDDNEIRVTRQKTKKDNKKALPAPPARDSSADEQRELLEMLDQSNHFRKRRSERLSLSQRKPTYTYSSKSESLSSTDLPITPINRRSTLDFVQLTQTQQKRKLKLDPKRPTSIVCTKMHRHEVVHFENTVASLGRFFVEDKVTGKTSHLVAGEPKRTINMLKGIARGCWILKHEWVSVSEFLKLCFATMVSYYYFSYKSLKRRESGSTKKITN